MTSASPSAPPSPAWTPARMLVAALAAGLALALADVLAFVRGAEGARLALQFVAYAVASAAAWRAAAAFDRSDHLRGAWRLLAANLLLVGSLALFPSGLLEGPGASERVRWCAALVTVAANACGVAGMVRFSMVWRRAGFELPGSARLKVLAWAALLAAALVAVGPDIAATARLALGGDVWSAAALVADLCDLVLVLLFLPVFLTAWSFAGGSLAWPFGFLAASLLTWLAFDGFQTYKALLGISPVVAKFVSALLHRLAALLVIAAAGSQRLALGRVAGPRER